VLCAGAGAMCCGVLVLVLWCAGALCWSARVLSRPVSHTVLSFILLPMCWCLDTSKHASGDQLLACLVAWPARLVQGRYFWCESC
jgi:hypothetical protein